MIKHFTLFVFFVFIGMQAFSQKKEKAPVNGSKIVKPAIPAQSPAPSADQQEDKSSLETLRILVLKGTETAEETAILEKEILAAYAGINFVQMESGRLRYIKFPSAHAAEAFRLGNPGLIILTPEALRSVSAALNCPSELASPELLEKLSRQ